MPDRTRSSEDQCAWLVGAFGNTRYAASLHPDQYPEWRETQKRARTGQADLTDFFPSEFYGYYDLGKETPELKIPPPLFLVRGGLPVVSEACAEVLRRFELGRTELRPVNLLRKDRKTPVLDGRYFGLFPGERHARFLPEFSTNLRPSTGVRFHAKSSFDDGSGVVSRAVLDPPDLWIDDRLAKGMMISGRLGRALIEAGWKDPMRLFRCRIVDPDAGETA